MRHKSNPVLPILSAIADSCGRNDKPFVKYKHVGYTTASLNVFFKEFNGTISLCVCVVCGCCLCTTCRTALYYNSSAALCTAHALKVQSWHRTQHPGIIIIIILSSHSINAIGHSIQAKLRCSIHQHLQGAVHCCEHKLSQVKVAQHLGLQVATVADGLEQRRLAPGEVAAAAEAAATFLLVSRVHKSQGQHNAVLVVCMDVAIVLALRCHPQLSRQAYQSLAT
jgi:hypothetical protein